MMNIRFALDITGIERGELAQRFSEHFTGHQLCESNDREEKRYEFKKNDNDVWKLIPNAKIIGQKPKENGGYVRGGADYCTTIISPPFSIINQEILYELSDILESADALANKSCRFKFLIDVGNLSPRQLTNLVSEIAQIENYLPLIFGNMCEFEKINLSALSELLENGTEDCTQFLSLQTNKTGIRYAESVLELNYLKSQIDPDKTDYLVAFTELTLALISKTMKRKTLLLPTPMSEKNPKFQFRTFMTSKLGMNGENYKATRTLLTKNLAGNSAWIDGKKPTKESTTV